jgi:hypothetical protein
MPGRIRTIDRHYVRLNDTMLRRVDDLAQMAGVSASDVVSFVLSEVFETGALGPELGEDSPTETPKAAVPRRPAPRSQRPADVIPITRRHRKASQTARIFEFLDLGYLRRQADEARRQAQTARACAVAACWRANSARALAGELIHVSLAPN